jgi:hypothetical protein
MIGPAQLVRRLVFIGIFSAMIILVKPIPATVPAPAGFPPVTKRKIKPCGNLAKHSCPRVWHYLGLAVWNELIPVKIKRDV